MQIKLAYFIIFEKVFGYNICFSKAKPDSQFRSSRKSNRSMREDSSH